MAWLCRLRGNNSTHYYSVVHVNDHGTTSLTSNLACFQREDTDRLRKRFALRQGRGVVHAATACGIAASACPYEFQSNPLGAMSADTVGIDLA